MYTKTSSVTGSTFAPDFLNGDQTISNRSAQLGDVITPGSTRYYQVHYVDTGVSGCFVGGGATFNITQGRRILWCP